MASSSKNVFLLLGVLLVLVFLISSEVAASHDQTTTESVELDGRDGYPGRGKGRRYPGKGCRYGCCRGYRFANGCKRCCATALEAPDAQFEDDVHN